MTIFGPKVVQRKTTPTKRELVYSSGMIGSTVSLILFCLMTVANPSDAHLAEKGVWLMTPNETHRVIEADSTLTITCSYAYEDEIKDIYRKHLIQWKWELPDFLNENSKLMNIDDRFRKTFGSNGTHMSSTMTLINVTHQDTGFFRFFYGHVEVKQYIYVFDNRNLVIINDKSRYPDYNLYFFHQGELGVHIPCKPAHPNVSVSLIHVDQLNKEPNFEDVLAVPHSGWSLEPELGLTLGKVTISNTGNYRCVGTSNNITDEKNFTISVKGIELTRLGDPGDPPEGSNVTIICRTLFAEIKFPSPPEWAYQTNNTGKMRIINEMSPPEGIQIKTHDYSNQRNTGGFTLNYYESQLDLFEINRNTYTTYQCKANKDKDAVTKIISFRIKDTTTNNNPVSNFVLFEKTIETTTLVSLSVTLAACLVLGLGIGVKLYLEKKQQVFPGVHKLLAGNVKEINRQLPIEEQTELLPYDKQWEFPRYRLKLGTQLGAGCFGRVVKAEAMGIKGSENTVETVAVKMIRSQTNMAAMEALVSEMKILIYLGSHLNVVTLLGACTKQMSKGELFIIVEYCRFGNLQNYLSNHRKNFVNLVDGLGNMTSDTGTREIAYVSQHETERNNQYGELSSDRRSAPEWPEHQSVDSSRYQRSTQPLYQNQSPAINYVLDRCISTCDLVSWSFQIARGMDYLVSKKVLHGDLAARNVLLADEGVVKLADFGMAKKMYYEGNYEKKGGLLPVKWMAIESLTDRVFSCESDVWSFGVLLWELFSLGKVPYPGMDAGHQLIKEIQKGYRMEKPEYAPNLFGEIMTNCWKSNPKERPTFSQLKDIISSHMTDLTYGS